jgi:DNA (cytosine-5)-methyltransferase 1
MTTFVSLFAGVGGFDLGFEQLGWECVGQVEKDGKCNEVLATHWPDVPRHNDVTTAIDWMKDAGLQGSVDVVCGGFPCQDVSTAGKRAGLAGQRTGLFWDALAFAQAAQARWIVLENVPGLLSSNQGRDFGTVLTALADAGYGYIEWRVLDTQFFGVPQRRRRVFIIAGTEQPGSRPVLTEQYGSRGDHPASGTQGQEATDGTGPGVTPYVKVIRSGKRDEEGNLPPEVWAERDVSPTLNAFDNGSESRATVIAFYSTGGANDAPAYDLSPTLKVGSSKGGAPPAVCVPPTVRRMTPTECERLQGFPDGWTDTVSDSQRYRQMGNAVSVPVARYIAHCIQEATC